MKTLVLGALTLMASSGPHPHSSGSGASTGADRFVYVAVGDSTAVGYGARQGSYVERIHARLRQRRPGATLHNLAQNGAASGDAVAHQLPRLRTLHPTLVTVAIGVNDLTRQIPPHRVAEHLARIVVDAQESGAVVVLANVPDASLAPAVPTFLRLELRAHVDRLNLEIAKLARRLDVPLADVCGHSRKVVPGHPELFGSDGFHPSDAGQAAWVDAMWPTIERLLDTGVRATGS